MADTEQLHIPEDRPLTSDEREMLHWLLTRSDSRGQSFIAQINSVRVISRCGCGCASIDFSIDGKIPEQGVGLEAILPEYYWNAESGGLCAIFVFAKENQLAGLETYSVDGMEVPTGLPSVDQLRAAPWL